MRTAARAAAAVLGAAAAAGFSLGVWHYWKNSELQRYKDRLEAQLKDPSSAQYHPESRLVRDGDGSAYCGAINAKNSFGGYVGYRYFVVTDADVKLQAARTASQDIQALKDEVAFLEFLRAHCAAAFDAAPSD